MSMHITACGNRPAAIFIYARLSDRRLASQRTPFICVAFSYCFHIAFSSLIDFSLGNAVVSHMHTLHMYMFHGLSALSEPLYIAFASLRAKAGCQRLALYSNVVLATD